MLALLLVGQSWRQPVADHAAAATAANTASEPFTGGAVRRRDRRRRRRHVAGAQDAEGPDGEVVRLAVLVDGDALAPHPAQRHVRGADAVRPQHDLVERFAARDVDVHADRRRPPPRADRAARRVDARLGTPSAARRTAASAQPAARTRGRRRRTGHVDLLDVEAGKLDARRCGRRARRRCRRRARRRRSAAAWARAAPCPRATADAHRPAVPVGQSRAAAGRDRRRPCRRRRRRWPAATPARRRARTTTRRSRGTRARPTSSAGSDAQSPGGHLERVTQRRPSSAGPAPCPPRRGPRPASRRPPTRRRRRARRPARRAARCRRRTRRARATTSGPTRCGDAALDRRPPRTPRPVARRRRRTDRARRRRRSSATRCTGTGGRAAPVDGVTRRGRRAAR